MPPVARRHSPSARQGNQEKSTLGSSRYGNRGTALNRSTLSQLRLSFSPSFSVSPPLPPPPSFSLSLWATRLVLRSFCLIRSVALTLSLFLNVTFRRTGSCRSLLKRATRRSTAGAYLVGRPQVESASWSFSSREGREARAQSGVTSGGTRISTSDEPLTRGVT